MARPVGVAGVILVLLGGLIGCAPAPLAAGPCDPANLGAVAGLSGVTVNGNSLEVGLVMPAGEPCLVHAWPDFEIADRRGHIADVGDRTGGPGSGAVVVLLRRQLAFNLEWGSWCADSPVAPLTARFDFVEGALTELVLPDGFGPAPCREPGRSILFMDPAFPVPGDK